MCVDRLMSALRLSELTVSGSFNSLCVELAATLHRLPHPSIFSDVLSAMVHDEMSCEGWYLSELWMLKVECTTSRAIGGESHLFTRVCCVY